MRRRISLVVGLILGSLILGGCDKCGDWDKFNRPSLAPPAPKTCHGEPSPG
jgi:hypothetical protein